MSVMRAKEEKHDRNTEKELFGGRVLSTIVDLLPHIQVVEGSAVEFKRNTTYVMEHNVRAKHVRHVGQRPGSLLRHTGDDVVENFESCNQNDVNGPGSCIKIKMSVAAPLD